MSCDVVHVQRISPTGQVWVSCLMMLYCIASYLNDSAFALCCFELYLWILLQVHVWHKCYCPLLLGREAIQTGKKSFHLITSLPDVIHWLVTPHICYQNALFMSLRCHRYMETKDFSPAKVYWKYFEEEEKCISINEISCFVCRHLPRRYKKLNIKSRPDSEGGDSSTITAYSRYSCHVFCLFLYFSLKSSDKMVIRLQQTPYQEGLGYISC